MLGHDKPSAARLYRMLKAGLVWHQHTQPWADAQIVVMPEPPHWLLELSTATHPLELLRIVDQYALSEPFVALDPERLNLYQVACLLLRHERLDLAWAGVLELSLLDESLEDWACDNLDPLRDSEFSPRIADEQFRRALVEFAQPIELARSDYEPLRDLCWPRDGSP